MTNTHKSDKGKKWTLEKQMYRDIHNNPFYEAICPHGIGHHKGIHGCDGCCQKAPKEIWDRVTKE